MKNKLGPSFLASALRDMKPGRRAEDLNKVLLLIIRTTLSRCAVAIKIYLQHQKSEKAESKVRATFVGRSGRYCIDSASRVV